MVLKTSEDAENLMLSINTFSAGVQDIRTLSHFSPP